MAAKIILDTATAWLPKRRELITATELSCLFKMNPYASVHKMIEQKVNNIKLNDNVYMRAGRILEPGVVIAVSEALKQDFRLVTTGSEKEKVFYVSDECRLGATPDAENVDGELLECKSCSPTRYDDWLENGPPRYYVLQLIAQIICTHAHPQGYLGIMNRDFPFKLQVWKLKLEPELRQNIIDEVNSFWKQVEKNHEYKHNKEFILKLKEELDNSVELCYKSN